MDDPDPNVGDEFTTADDIRNGDLVRWDRDADGQILLRRVEEWQLDSTPGPVFRIVRANGPLSFSLTPVK